MKIFLYISLLSILSSCTIDSQIGDGVIEIIGVRDGTQVVRGMGVCIDDSTILTSAHVVRDDRVRYEIGDMRYEISERDFETDIASMKIAKNEKGRMSNVCNNPKQYIGKTGLKIGENVTILVIRSGSIMTLSGSITSLTGTVLAYDTLGRTELLTGVLLTDIATQPGDSGAPILDTESRVVDVVHLQ